MTTGSSCPVHLRCSARSWEHSWLTGKAIGTLFPLFLLDVAAEGWGIFFFSLASLATGIAFRPPRTCLVPLS